MELIQNIRGSNKITDKTCILILIYLKQKRKRLILDMHLLYVEHFQEMNLRSPVRVYIHIDTIDIFDLSEPLSRGSECTEYVLNERTLSNTVRTRAKRVFNRFLVQNVFYHRSPRPGLFNKSLKTGPHSMVELLTS